AAQRYTECRLAPLANQLLAGIDEETVDFGDNYSGEFTEPQVLPARFPNLLVNGSTGIAVGMATNIPPHNLGEVVDATIFLIADLVNSRELDGIRHANDESAKGKVRLVIELKRDANANVVLNNLFKHTPLQTSFGVNMVALVDGVPRTVNLRDALVAYIDHQI